MFLPYKIAKELKEKKKITSSVTRGVRKLALLYTTSGNLN